MNPWVLERGAAAEPWRLWTCHAIHFGWTHLLLNLAALAVPFALVPFRTWAKLGLGLFLVAPCLSLALLPWLDGGQYRGASGLACAAWSMAGCLLLAERRWAAGLPLLTVLAAKLLAEAFVGSLLRGGPGWTSLPAAHVWGAALGASGAALYLVTLRRTHRSG